MAATEVALPNPVVQVEAAVVYPAMAVSAALAVAVAVAPEEMVEVERMITEEEVVVAPFSMVAMVDPFMSTKGALADTSAVEEAASQIMAMVPLARVEQEVEEETPVAASWTLPMEAMEPIAPTVPAAVAGATATISLAMPGVAVVAMAVLAVAVAAREIAGLCSVVAMEEMVDSAADQASA
jgi:hypothetical protein